MMEAEGERSPAVLIVGSNGRMGRMLLERALARGIEANGIDIPYHEGMAAKVGAADIVLLCVPARNIGETTQRLAPWMRKNAILADITSVKEEPMRQMRQCWQGAIVGTHPLFGPNPAPEGDLPVVIVPDADVSSENSRIVANFFEKLGFRTFEADAAAHDKAMAKIQNMNFITNVAYFAALAGDGDLLPFLTPSFGRRQEAAKKMLTEDASMFSGLFEANGHSHEAVRQFRKYLNVAASGDIDLLCQRAQWWWRDDANVADDNGKAESLQSGQE